MREFAQDFQKNGYFILPNLIPESGIARIFADLSAVFDTALGHIGLDDVKPLSASEKYLYLQAHQPGIKSHCYDLMGRLDSVHRFIASGELATIGRIIFNTPLILDHVQIRVDEPGSARSLPLHQELGQISVLNMTVWCPLIDITDTSGGLACIPGSHKRGRVPHRYFPEMNNYHGIREDQFDRSKVRHLEMKRGDAVVFHPFLFHGSAPNRSDRLRWTVVARFNELTEVGYLRDETAPLRMPQHIDEDDAQGSPGFG